MQKDTKLFDDMARMAEGAFSTVAGMGKEAEQAFKQQIEHFLARMDVVTREEFEVVKAMASKALEENEALKKELAALKTKKPSAAKKSPAKKKANTKKK